MPRNCFARKWYLCCAGLCSLLFSLIANAQAPHVDGTLPYPDTSYTLWSAFTHTRKGNPEIQMVPLLRSKHIKRKTTYYKYSKAPLDYDVFYDKRIRSKKRPTIMIIHGGGWRSGNRTMHHALAQHLAQRGYVCFTVDYTLSTSKQYPQAIYDLKHALRYIVTNAKKYYVDTSKIAVLGFSAGGELAAFLGATIGDRKFEADRQFESNITITPAPIHAVVDIDGTLSFTHAETGEGDDSKKISAGTYWFGYSKKDSFALWQEASPLTHVGPRTPPTLFLNSSVARMHAGRDDFIKVLNQYNIYSEVKSFDKAPHGFCLFHPWFEPTVNYIDDFLKRVLK